MDRRMRAMRQLGMSTQEIEGVMECDRQIDQGAKLFELSDEQKQVVKKMSGTGTKTVYQFQKRERKADNDKREIIQTLDDALCDLVDDVEVVNPEREILFTYNEKKYKIVLSAPRG